MKVNDFLWKPGITVDELVEKLSRTGFQSVELKKAAEIIIKMKLSGAKIILTFTSNLATSGLRGFFSQLIRLKLIDIIVTTVGSIEEDIMKAYGEEFIIGKFSADDIELHDKGINRVGNLFIKNESYMKFEEIINQLLKELYNNKKRWSSTELLFEIGKRLKDNNSFLKAAAENDVKIFCPGITDGAFGFHLFLFQQKNNDFIIDVIKDFKEIMFSLTPEEKKGIIALGGGISKHYAILASLLNNGLDYAVYITTDTPFFGSLSGATTNEAKSWGKIKDDSDAVTIFGDATIIFPLVMIKALEFLNKEKIINYKKELSK